MTKFRTAPLASVLLPSLAILTPHVCHAQAEPLPTAAATTPRLVLETERTGKEGADLFFFPPGLVTVRVKTENITAPTAIGWTARDFDGRTVGEGTVTPESNTPTVVRINATRPGIIYVTAEMAVPSGTVAARGETRFAVLTPRPVPAKRSVTLAAPLPVLYGVCAHLKGGKGEADTAREVALMAALGFRGCRFDYNWTNVQPERDTWNWTTYDRIFGLMEKYRIEPLPILAYTTRWATTGDPDAKDWHQWHNAPPIAADYARFASESAKHYARTTRYWEIWNEPDIAFWLGTAEQYATVFDAANNAIHAANTNALVMNGGFSETQRRPEFIPTWMTASKTKPDIFAYHSHNAFPNMLRASDHVKGYLTPQKWTMPVWLNEAGYSSAGRQTERDQAVALVKKMSAAPSLGFSGYFLYDIRNDGVSPDENEHNFGLVRQDFTPKASAVAVHTLMKTLEGQHFVSRVSVPGMSQAWVLLFERTDAKGGTLVLWNEAATTVPLFWQVPATASRISLMGEQTRLPAANHLVSVPLTPEPQFVSFTGPRRGVRLVGQLLQPNSPVTAAPGDNVPFRVTLQNPLGTSLRGTLTLNPTGGWKTKPSTLTVDIPAKGTREYSATVTASAASAASGRPEDLLLTLTSPGLPSGATARVPLLPATTVPKREAVTLGDFSTRTTPLKTLGRGNIVSLFEATPMQELFFHGDDDLSAKLYLSRTPQGLSLAVRVKDDVFAQTEVAGMEWKGDSVQFALFLPTGDLYEGVLALTRNGPVAYFTLAPKGVATGQLWKVPLAIRREGNETLYDVLLPAELPGKKALPDRFRFSLIVNDNDGAGRKGWVEWTPGIGQAKDPSLFPYLIVR